MGAGQIPTWNQALLRVEDWMLGVPLTQVLILVDSETIQPTCGFHFTEISEEQHCGCLMALFMAKVTDCIRGCNSKMKPDFFNLSIHWTYFVGHHSPCQSLCSVLGHGSTSSPRHQELTSEPNNSELGGKSICC